MAQLQMGSDSWLQHLWDAPMNKMGLLQSQCHKIHTAIKKSKKPPKQICLKTLYFQIVILTLQFQLSPNTQIPPHSLPCVITLQVLSHPSECASRYGDVILPVCLCIQQIMKSFIKYRRASKKRI